MSVGVLNVVVKFTSLGIKQFGPELTAEGPHS